jgi:hypothetical protein
MDSAVCIAPELDALTTKLLLVSNTTRPLNGFKVSFVGTNASTKIDAVTDPLTKRTLTRWSVGE